ncbi:MAG: class I adenylate-forming enzyme family protein [Pseudodonghicola sp.]
MDPAARTLPGLLERAARSFPDRIAAVEGTTRLSFAELLAQVHRMANLLHARGIRRGDRVALMMPPSVPHLIAYFGTALLGAIPVAFHVRESEPTLRRIADSIMPRLLVYDVAYQAKAEALLADAPQIAGRVRAVSTLAADPGGAPDAPLIPRDLALYPADHDRIALSPDDIATIVLSSGTTGLPKGVIHTHGSVTGGVEQGAEYMGHGPEAATINIFTTAFVGWLNCTLPQLHAGSKIVYLPKWDPAEYLRTIATERITCFILVPTMWRMLLAAGPEAHDLSSVTRVGFAGEAIDAETMRAIRARVCDRVMNTYGTTETGPWGGCTIMLPEDYARGGDLRSIGRAAFGVGIRVIAPGGAVDDVLSPGTEGELILRGPSLAAQIWDRPELTRKVFDNGWWRSGDLATMDADGYITLSGRVDDMIISGGINIMPGQIEDLLLTHASVRECAVAGVPSADWGQEITAFVIAQGRPDEAALRAHLTASDLSHYKHPRRYVFLDDLPKGHTGKINRKALKESLAKV